MKKKSRFITLLLSFIPGLSHFYLGFGDRGFIYLIIFGMTCFGTVALGGLTGIDAFMGLMMVGVVVIWLIALIDAFSIIGSMRRLEGKEMENMTKDEENYGILNKKIITLGLSVVPGAGHMYLGYQKKGLAFMSIFFSVLFLVGLLRLNFLVFVLPLIWFYSFFDAFHMINGSDVEDIDIWQYMPYIKNEHIGKGSIILGFILILNRIIYPIADRVLSNMFDLHIGYEIRNYTQALIVAIIFIVIGIKMLKRNREIDNRDEVEEDEED